MPHPLNPRLNAFRPDLADARLKSQVEADRFVEGRPAIVTDGVAPLRRAPRPDAVLDTEGLMGEALLVFEEDDEGWSFVQLSGDNYVGYMPSAAIGARGEAPPATSHRVCVPQTLRFPGPDIKAPPLGHIPMGARLTVTGQTFDHNAVYLALSGGGCVVSQHVAPIDAVAPDFVAVAESFVGVPYLWGGKSAFGIDCSGLVQIACDMAGIAAPRDSGDQERELGTRIAGIEALRRGDLIFWPGHVGIMLDGQRLLHANAFHMMTAIEPLDAAIERFAKKDVALRAVRRLPPRSV